MRRRPILPLLLSMALWVSPEARAADGSLYLPPAPGGPGGDDQIDTPSGFRCRQSINSNGPYLDLGLGVSVDSLSSSTGAAADGSARGFNPDGLAYARLVIPLGDKPKRIDCARLYELEIERLKLEIEQMKMGLE